MAETYYKCRYCSGKMKQVGIFTKIFKCTECVYITGGDPEPEPYVSPESEKKEEEK